ncbi:hypothetical protein MTO96_033726 [Rhipicephalus appendiculatus]
MRLVSIEPPYELPVRCVAIPSDCPDSLVHWVDSLTLLSSLVSHPEDEALEPGEVLEEDRLRTDCLDSLIRGVDSLTLLSSLVSHPVDEALEPDKALRCSHGGPA